MLKYISFVLTIFIIGCGNRQEKNLRFTKEQISLLNIKSTKTLNVETDSVTKIDLNPFLNNQDFNLGTLVKEVKLIPLETTNESLLDAIYKVIVTDSNIFIHDKFKGGGIVIFDNSGKFIRRIPNGKGPGELIRLYDIDFDKEKNELIAYQHSFLHYYTPSGQFIRMKRLPFGFYNFTVIPEGYVFKTLDREGNKHLGSLKDFTLFITDKNFKIKSAGLPFPPSKVNYGGYNYLYNNNNTLYVTQRYSDTIYQYKSTTNQLKARYILDYSKKKLPERYLQGAMDEFRNATIQNDYYYYLGEYLDTESQHVFFLRNQHTGSRPVVYRDKMSGNLIGGTNVCFDLNEIPPIAFPKAVFRNYLISWYLPQKNDLFSYNSSIITEEDKLRIKGLTENDNPVLVFYKLKKF